VKSVVVDGETLTIGDVVHVARHQAQTTLSDVAAKRMRASAEWVDQAANGKIQDANKNPLPVYGVNTGYGSLARVRIDTASIQQLSWNLVRSHTAGVGPALPEDVVRAMMLLRANTLAKGASGCRPVVVQTLLTMIERGLVPIIPSRGSCGSSGDLAPLAHLAIVLFHDKDHPDAYSGRATFRGRELTGQRAMAQAKIERLIPGPKEGLAMTNGAQLCTALAALAAWDASRLVLQGEIAAAMSWEAMRGVTGALHPDVHQLRPYPGAIACAAHLRQLLQGSTLVDSDPDTVQDAYSLRCTPQVVGAVRDGLSFVLRQIRVELNSVTDNPVILVGSPELNKAYSAGHFHGEPVGMACDHLKLVACELGDIAERRLFRLTTGNLSARLPPLLAHRDRPGMGLMVPHTTAAALVSENRSLAFPSTVDSIPTCEDQEDLVAMSTTAARQAMEVVQNCQIIVAIELLSAAHGLWWRQEKEPTVQLGRGSQVALDVIEKLTATDHRCPADDIASLTQAVRDGTILAAVEAELGPLPEVSCG
jgi:histidine ammonia-lyase